MTKIHTVISYLKEHYSSSLEEMSFSKKEHDLKIIHN